MAFFAPLIPLIASAAGSAATAVGTAGAALAAGGTATGLAGSLASTLGLSAAAAETLSTVGTALSVAGAAGSVGMTVAGAQQEAKSQEAQAAAQAQQTRVAVNAERSQNAKLLARQQNIAAAAGLDPSTGSPLEIALDTAFTGELNAQMLRRQGMIKARSLRTTASNTGTSGLFNAFSKGISNSGTMLGSFMKP